MVPLVMVLEPYFFARFRCALRSRRSPLVYEGTVRIGINSVRVSAYTCPFTMPLHPCRAPSTLVRSRCGPLVRGALGLCYA